MKTVRELEELPFDELEELFSDYFVKCFKPQDQVKDEDKKFFEIIRRVFISKHETYLDTLPCMICTNLDVTAYEILHKFSSDFVKIRKNICNKHKKDLEIKARELDKN